VNRNRIEL